jgi:hypothetical protein
MVGCTVTFDPTEVPAFFGCRTSTLANGFTTVRVAGRYMWKRHAENAHQSERGGLAALIAQRQVRQNGPYK